jgi:hypothetical protein
LKWRFQYYWERQCEMYATHAPQLLTAIEDIATGDAVVDRAVEITLNASTRKSGWARRIWAGRGRTKW